MAILLLWMRGGCKDCKGAVETEIPWRGLGPVGGGEGGNATVGTLKPGGLATSVFFFKHFNATTSLPLWKKSSSNNGNISGTSFKIESVPSGAGLGSRHIFLGKPSLCLFCELQAAILSLPWAFTALTIMQSIPGHWMQFLARNLLQRNASLGFTCCG